MSKPSGLQTFMTWCRRGHHLYTALKPKASRHPPLHLAANTHQKKPGRNRIQNAEPEFENPTSQSIGSSSPHTDPPTHYNAYTAQDLLPEAHMHASRGVSIGAYLSLKHREGMQHEPEYPSAFTPDIWITSDDQVSSSPMSEWDYQRHTRHLLQEKQEHQDPPETPIAAALGLDNLVRRDRILAKVTALDSELESLSEAITGVQQTHDEDTLRYADLVAQNELPVPVEPPPSVSPTTPVPKAPSAPHRQNPETHYRNAFYVGAGIIEALQISPAYLNLLALDPGNLGGEFQRNPFTVVLAFAFILLTGFGYVFLAKEVVSRSIGLVPYLVRYHHPLKRIKILGLTLWTSAFVLYCCALATLRHSTMTATADMTQNNAPDLGWTLFVLTFILPIVLGMMSFRDSSPASPLTPKANRESHAHTAEPSPAAAVTPILTKGERRAAHILAGKKLRSAHLLELTARRDRLRGEKESLEDLAEQLETDHRTRLKAQYERSNSFYRTHLYNLELARTVFTTAQHELTTSANDSRHHKEQAMSVARVLELAEHEYRRRA